MEVWEQHGQFIIGLLCGAMLTLTVLLLIGSVGMDPDNWE